MTPDLPPVPPGRWLPRLEAARQLGITERTLQRRMKQGLVRTRHDEHNRVQVYVPDRPDSGHEQGQDMRQDTAMVPAVTALRHAEVVVRILAEQLQIQQTALSAKDQEIGALRAQLAAQGVAWWRVLWQRLSGRTP